MSFNPNSGSTALLSHTSSAASNSNVNPANSLSLEPNPFEQSFLNNESLESSLANSVTNSTALHQSNAARAPHIQLPAGSPPILTPGGRRHILPPLNALSPNNITGAGHQQHPIPETPGLMWSNILGSTATQNNNNLHNPANTNNNHHNHHHHSQSNPLADQQDPRNSVAGHQHHSSLGTTATNGIPASTNQQFMLHRRTGLTPNESGIRTGLTPGGANFLNSIQLPGLNTPNSLLHIPSLTPGVSSLLDMNQLTQQNTQTIPQQNPQPTQQTQTQQPSQVQAIHATIPQLEVQLKQPRKTSTSNSKEIKREASTPALELPPKKKRGRKTKLELARQLLQEKEKPSLTSMNSSTTEEKPSPAETSTMSLDSSSPASGLRGKRGSSVTEDDKRKNFLERNRLAASKCRLRKKVLVNKMKEELNFYSSEHATLTSQVNTLREQVITLRTILFAHKDCPALLENVGGAETLNTVLNATNFASQIPQQRPLQPTIVPHTTSIPPIEEQSKIQQSLLNNENPTIATAAAVAVTTNNALNQLYNNQPNVQRAKEI